MTLTSFNTGSDGTSWGGVFKGLFWLLVLVAACGGYWVWQNPDEAKSTTADYSHRIGKFFLNLFEKNPESGDESIVAEPLPPVPPENVYYTLKRVEYATPSNGKKFIEAATSVRKVGEGGSKFVVEAGTDRAVVDPLLLTRDPKEIQKVMREARATAQRLSAGAAMQRSSAAAADANALARLDAKIKEVTAEKVKAEAIVEEERRYNRKTYMGSDPKFLRLELERLQAERSALLNKNGVKGTASSGPDSGTAGAPAPFGQSIQNIPGGGIPR